MRILKFISLWLSLTICFSLFNSAFVKPEILIQAMNSALFTIGFYFSYHYLIKPFLYKGKVATFTLLYLLVITCLSLISRLSTYGVYAFENNKFYLQNYWTEPVFYTSNFTLMLLVTSSLLSFRFLKDKMQTQSILESLEKEKISTELSFLKAQINPHFLFNSLNNILFQIDKSNREARDTLLKFSEMLRYQLYDCSADRIEIEKELQYLKNYIEIQMLRKTEKYNYTPEGLMKSDSAFFAGRVALMPEPKRWKECLTMLNKMYNEDFVSTETFSAIKCPTLIMNGDRDGDNSIDAVVKCAKSIKGSQLAIIAGCWHVVFFCNFPAVWAAIDPFLHNE